MRIFKDRLGQHPIPSLNELTSLNEPDKGRRQCRASSEPEKLSKL